MIRKMYGHTFKEKYKRITRGIPLSQDRRFRVVDEALFEDFMNENVRLSLYRTSEIIIIMRRCI